MDKILLFAIFTASLGLLFVIGGIVFTYKLEQKQEKEIEEKMKNEN